MNSQHNKQNNNDILKEILLEIQNLKSEIHTIQNELQQIKQSTSNMDHHISFVESIWSVAKSPFTYGLQLYYGNSKNIKYIKNIPTTHPLN